jgi:hypothetical protein
MTGNLKVDKRVGGYGTCVWSLRTIFVDASIRISGRKNYSSGRDHIYPPRKATYKTHFEPVLVHELVHYRFPYMKHGVKFGERIEQILEGKRFESKHITPLAIIQGVIKGILMDIHRSTAITTTISTQR